MKHFLLPFFFATVFNGCTGQSETTLPETQTKETKPANSVSKIIFGHIPDPALQVSEYIRRMHEDGSGNLWFGTNGDGVAKYDGDTLVYYTMRQGFGGGAVRGIVEDKKGNLWFATDGGVSRYNKEKENLPCNKRTCIHNLIVEKDLKEHQKQQAELFTNLTMQDGLANNQLWSILLDKDGNFWFGTENGVSFYDGKTFSHFELPVPDLTKFPDTYPAPKLVGCMFQDKAGIIWFGTNGGGVYYYDASSQSKQGRAVLGNLSEKDGLCNNVIQSILQDKKGNMWFGSRFGGASCYNYSAGVKKDPKDFKNYDFINPEGQHRNFVWTLFEDKLGNIWFGTAGDGVFLYNGKISTTGNLSLQNYGKNEGLTLHVQSMLEDKKGNLWFGCSGGLFRLDPNSRTSEKFNFINVTKTGPWPK